VKWLIWMKMKIIVKLQKRIIYKKKMKIKICSKMIKTLCIVTKMNKKINLKIQMRQMTRFQISITYPNLTTPIAKIIKN